MSTITHTQTLVPMDCGQCGVVFAVPDTLRAELIETRRTWYCPNGHPRVFTGQRETDRLRAELDQAKANAAWHAKRAREERERVEHERARANGYKGALAKTKKRVAAGVCPCCQRSFTQLARHMATKHPDYAAPTNGGAS